MAGVQPCDLLFFSDRGGMGDAISESTGRYTHVAIVERAGEEVWIIDATPRYGVSRRLLDTLADGVPDVYRLAEGLAADTALVLGMARALLGQPYDHAFLPGNGAQYCSELVYESYVRVDMAAGDTIRLFEAAPMNWRNAKGKLPRYWRRHFRRLGMAVPEGEPGTNPSDMARSPLLRRVSGRER